MKFTPNSNNMYLDSLTYVTELNISLEDNFTNTVLSNHSMSDVTLITDKKSNYCMTSLDSSEDSEGSNMSFDSLDYNNRNKTVTNHNYQKQRKPVKRMLQFNGKCCIDKPDNDRTKQELSYCNSKYKTAPIASSTMIDVCDSVMADEVTCQLNSFVPSSLSTTMNEFIPCELSTMVKTTQQFSVSQIDKTFCSGIETWSINDNEDAISLQQHYIRRHYRVGNSTCFSRDLLSTKGNSTIWRDEFSLDMLNCDAPFINANSKLPRTKTVTQLNYVQERQQTYGIKGHKVVECKKPQKLLKLRQVMKNVKKGFIKKTKTIQTQQSKPSVDQPVLQDQFETGVLIHDKKAVARKLRRFRESFRLKDTRNLQTLATL